MKVLDVVYADCIDKRCPNLACRAAPGEYCLNPINGRPKRIPCVARTKPETNP